MYVKRYGDVNEEKRGKGKGRRRGKEIGVPPRASALGSASAMQKSHRADIGKMSYIYYSEEIHFTLLYVTVRG